MKNKHSFRKLPFLLFVIFLATSCSDEIDRPVFPLSAEIFHSVSDKQVAFTALTHSAVNWSWDFGDGKTSTEQNPVHVYDDGGYYVAKLIATDASGNSATSEVNLAIALTPYVLLTGGPTATNGKTWKLTASHTTNDKIVNSDANLSLFDEDIPSLPIGAIDLYLGLGEAYDDEFTFYFDGSYGHDTKDGAGFGGIVYAMVAQQMGISTITKTGGEAVFGQDAFAFATYSPEADAKFVFVEKEDFSIPTIPDFATAVVPPGIPIVTYPNVMTIDFPNSTEFVGLMDFHRKVIVQEVNDNTMRLVMFMTLSPDAIVSQSPLIALSTTAMILTFEVVK